MAKKVARKDLLKYLSMSLKLQWQLTHWRTVFLPLIDISTSLISIGRSYMYAQIINLITAYISGSVPSVFPQFWQLLIITALAGVAEPLIANFQSYQNNKTTIQARNQLDRIIARRCAELDAAHFEDPEFQDIIERVERLDVGWVLRNLSSISSDIVTMLVATLAVLKLNWILFVLAIVSAIPRLISSVYSASRYREINVKLSPKRRLNWYLRDSLITWTHIREIRAAGAISGFLKRLIGNQDEMADIELKAQRHFSRIEAVTDTFGVATSVFTRVWLFMRIITTRGAFSIGDYTFYDSLVSRLENSSSSLVRNFRSIYEELINVEDYFIFMNADTKLTKPKNPMLIARGDHIPSIAFENVSFRYPGTKKHILKDVSFTLNPAEKMALIGVNGAGKTTLIKLLLRHYDPDSGRILIDGVDLRKIDLDSWYHKLAIIQQDFNHYPLTVAQNVTFQLQGPIDKRKLKQAISDAQADFVYELPKKERTVLTRFFDDSVELSGGQWQKIALARAFYRQANILVLDEPTSAIDARAESEIFHRLWHMQRDKGAIVISHRFSTVREADQIIVLDAGRVSEHGTHESLMKQKGVYHELFTKQAKSYQ